MEPLIIPAIIATSQSELDETLNRLRGKAERVQLDVMDGIFVPTRSLDWDIEIPRGFTYEVHVMSINPIRVLRGLAGRTHIALLHYESIEYPDQAILELKSLGFKVYIAVAPDTSITSIEPYLDQLDGVLVMTVTPGRYGAPFIPKTLDKVRRIRKLRNDLPIEVDGAMNPMNVKAAWDAGANEFVSGSFVLKAVDPSQAIQQLKMAIYM